MDPKQAGKYEKKVKKDLSINLYRSIFSENIKFCKVAGGTSKYIAIAHKIPFLYVYRNEVEKFLIDKMVEKQLTIKDDKVLTNLDILEKR